VGDFFEGWHHGEAIIYSLVSISIPFVVYVVVSIIFERFDTRTKYWTAFFVFLALAMGLPAAYFITEHNAKNNQEIVQNITQQITGVFSDSELGRPDFEYVDSGSTKASVTFIGCTLDIYLNSWKGGTLFNVSSLRVDGNSQVVAQFRATPAAETLIFVEQNCLTE